MRIFLIIDETNFYLPDFVADLLRCTEFEFVGAALVTKIPVKNNIEKYMIRHWYFLKIQELLKLIMKKSIFKFKDIFLRHSPNGEFYSVRSAFKCFQIDFFEVKNNINKAEYIQKIKCKKPDIIVSSNSLIFGKELLNIPKYCINRHSALLPSYGGLWPVFQAIRRREQNVGVTVHTMEQKIDKGIILSQQEIPVQKVDTLDSLYQKCYACSAAVTIDAIRNIINKSAIPLNNQAEPARPSYFSFPTKKDWKEFRETGRMFI